MEHEHKKISRKLLIFDALLVVLVLAMVFLLSNMFKPNPTQEIVQTKQIESTAFENISLKARAVYVYDITRKQVLYEKNSTEQLPLASLTKLMMALVASDMAEKDSRITIRKEFLNEDGNSGLAVGETWKLKDLLDFSLVVSSNDGSRALASVIGSVTNGDIDFNNGQKDFVSRMNDKANSLGLSRMYFVNVTGLDVGTVSGGYGTAEDVGTLLAHIISKKPTLLEATTYEKTVFYSNTEKHTAKNTNSVMREIPGLIASKTGYTDLAGGNLAIAFDPSIGEPIAIIVLGSTREGRFEDVSKLVEASVKYIRE